MDKTEIFEIATLFLKDKKPAKYHDYILKIINSIDGVCFLQSIDKQIYNQHYEISKQNHYTFKAVPSQSSMHLIYGFIESFLLTMLEQFDESLQILNLYKVLYPLESSIYVLASLNIKNNASLEDALKAVALSPSAPNYFHLAKNSTSNLRNQKALFYFNKAIELEPNFLNAHLEAASLYYSRKEYYLAYRHYKKVNKNLPSSELFLIISKCLCKINKYKKAIKVLRKGQTLFCEDRNFLIEKANVYSCMQKHEKSIQYLEEYLAEFPKDLEAINKLAQAKKDLIYSKFITFLDQIDIFKQELRYLDALELYEKIRELGHFEFLYDESEVEAKERWACDYLETLLKANKPQIDLYCNNVYYGVFKDYNLPNPKCHFHYFKRGDVVKEYANQRVEELLIKTPELVLEKIINIASFVLQNELLCNKKLFNNKYFLEAVEINYIKNKIYLRVCYEAEEEFYSNLGSNENYYDNGGVRLCPVCQESPCMCSDPR